MGMWTCACSLACLICTAGASMYTPSEQEARWFARQNHHRICHWAHEPEELRLAHLWLGHTAKCKSYRPVPDPVGDERKVFSRFTRTTGIEYIEPLTGVARHPFANVGCPGIDASLPPTVSLLNKSHLLLADFCGRGGPKPRALLYDLGCAGPSNNPSFRLSLMKLHTMYHRRCLTFNHMYGWELQPQEHNAWWATVPAEARHKISFFNVGVAPEPWRPEVANRSDGTGSFGFVHTLKATARPDDFVAVKLDVDNSEVEYSIVQAILETPGVADLIDEFFFEFHFQYDPGTDLARFWGPGLTKKVDEALVTMQQLRDRGIRAHFWV